MRYFENIRSLHSKHTSIQPRILGFRADPNKKGKRIYIRRTQILIRLADSDSPPRTI